MKKQITGERLVFIALMIVALFVGLNYGHRSYDIGKHDGIRSCIRWVGYSLHSPIMPACDSMSVETLDFKNWIYSTERSEWYPPIPEGAVE